jgi:hypothetical protein
MPAISRQECPALQPTSSVAAADEKKIKKFLLICMPTPELPSIVTAATHHLASRVNNEI